MYFNNADNQLGITIVSRLLGAYRNKCPVDEYNNISNYDESHI